MVGKKSILFFIAVTFTYILSSVQSRPQNDDNDLFAVDGFSFDEPAEGLDPITFERTTRLPSSTTPTEIVSTERCITNCPITSEYNPVCGTDGIAYRNPGQLGCARRCGRAINLAYYGSCTSRNARG